MAGEDVTQTTTEAPETTAPATEPTVPDKAPAKPQARRAVKDISTTPAAPEGGQVDTRSGQTIAKRKAAERALAAKRASQTGEEPPEPEAPPATAPAKVEIPAALRKRAEQNGLSAAIIDAASSPEQLEEMVNAIDRSLAKLLASQRNGKTEAPAPAAGNGHATAPAAQAPPQPKPEAPAAGSATPAPTAPAAAPATLDILQTLDESVSDPEVVKAIRAIGQHYVASQNSQRRLEGLVTMLLEHQLRQQAEAEETAFERFIADQGEDWHDVFGQGPVSGLDPEGDHYKNRKELWQSAKVLQASFRQRGLDAPQLSALWEREQRALFGNLKKSSSASQRAANQPRDAAGQFTATARVTSGSSVQPGDSRDAQTRAIAAVRAKKRELGIVGD